MNSPYLSIVTAVRNDNYGGDFILRLQRSIDWNTKWLERFEVSSEIVLVNWNPIVGKPSLEELLVWPSKTKYTTYRIITVSNEIHLKFDDSQTRESVPLFEFLAKNVGIRRSKGTLVLSTNADILFHPNLCQKLAQDSFEHTSFYRANRLDFSANKSKELGQFFEAGFAISLKGFMYKFDSRFDKMIQYRLLKVFNTFRLKWELFKCQFPKFFSLLRIPVVYNNGGFLCHCLNSGDFLLMHKKNWIGLRAYPEYTSIATHTDALFNIIAFDQLKERVFDEPIFHQQHERRYGWGEIKTDVKYEKAYQLFEEAADDVKNGLSIEKYLNSDDWGLANVQLEEQVI